MPQSVLQLSRSRIGIYVSSCMVSCHFEVGLSVVSLLKGWQAHSCSFNLFILYFFFFPSYFPHPLRYYCTLTIRESILKVNGSRIKGWWRLHHFISTVCAAVLLIWPQGETWQLFRTQFMYFNVYISELINFFRHLGSRVIYNRIPRFNPIPSIRLSKRRSVSLESDG